jgi:hypothetical protein
VSGRYFYTPRECRVNDTLLSVSLCKVVSFIRRSVCGHKGLAGGQSAEATVGAVIVDGEARAASEVINQPRTNLRITNRGRRARGRSPPLIVLPR